MLVEKVDLVIGAWRRTTSVSALSIIEEAFADCDLPLLPGPTPLWGSRACSGYMVRRVCGWQRGAYPILHEALGHPADRSELPSRSGLHMDFVERRCGRSHHEGRTTTPLERTFCAVPLQQTKGSLRRGCKRPIRYLNRQGDHSPPVQLRRYLMTSNVLCFHALLPLFASRVCDSSLLLFCFISRSQAHVTSNEHLPMNACQEKTL